MFQMGLMMLFMLLLGVTCDSQMLRCDQQDQSSLLRFKHDLVFDSTKSYKLDTWNSSSDCCAWNGVTCRPDGHVIAIRLEGQSISGGTNDSNSPLFDLHHLQLLDLSSNNFNDTQIPSGIGKLVNLVHLNLSNSYFAGQVPPDISMLTSLLTLDISDEHYYSDEARVGLKLENPKLSGLIRNLTRLTELRLDGVNMSAEREGYAWGHALSSSLPRLQVLSLKNCGLHGKLTPSIFTMPTLQVLNLGNNDKLLGTLPEIITTTLTELGLWDCGLSGSISDIRWENLENLVELDLSDNALNGTIPQSLFSLPSLSELDLSGNQVNGEVGEFPILSPSPLRVLHLDGNKLEGPIPTSLFNLHKLEFLDLSYNNFSGTFDLSNLFQNLSNLKYIGLSFNSLSVIESVGSTFYSSFPYQLKGIGLASCNLKAFPSSLTNRSIDLFGMDLSDNSIVGEIPSWILKPSLRLPNLSHNFLTGFKVPSPNLTFLRELAYLDLSSNLLQGQVPLAPLGVVYAPYLEFLSLSNNNFHGGILSSLCNISRDTQPVIDLSNNWLSGTIPSCLTRMGLGVLNLKRNNLSGNIPDAFHDDCSLQTLDLSYNHFQGTVPKSMMNCKELEVINLGNNGLNDEFPFWLMDISSLRVLVLRSNKFYGHVRYETSKQASGWSKLQIIDIAANNFSGELPPEIFKFWTGMKANIGIAQPKSDKLGFGDYYQDMLKYKSHIEKCMDKLNT